jgi:hypothetical protein
MSDQLLINVLRVPEEGTLAPGDFAVITHGLRSLNQPVVPKLVQPDRASPIIVTAADEFTVTFQNNGTDPEFAYFRFERGLSYEVDAETLVESYWQGAASGGGGGGVPYSALGEVIAPGGPYPAIAAGTVVAVVGGTMVAANAASLATAPAVGIYLGSVANRIRTSGVYSGLVGLPNNSTVYLADGGGLSATPPVGAGKVSQYFGQTRGTTQVFVDPKTFIVL